MNPKEISPNPTLKHHLKSHNLVYPPLFKTLEKMDKLKKEIDNAPELINQEKYNYPKNLRKN